MAMIEPNIESWKGPPIDQPGGGGDDGEVEARYRAIKDRLLRLETRADQFGTKTDLAETKHSIVVWLVSVGVGAAATTIGATLGGMVWWPAFTEWGERTSVVGRTGPATLSRPRQRPKAYGPRV
jgi:hypothetical protein